MADKQESALTQQSDCKWVRALDANGNSIRISKEDLAAVSGRTDLEYRCKKAIWKEQYFKRIYLSAIHF